MNKAIEFIKEHPIGTAVAAAVAVGGYIILSGSGSSDTADTGYQGGVISSSGALTEAGTQLQAAQIAANQQAHSDDTAAAVANHQIDAQVIKFNLDSQDTNQQDVLSAHIADLQADIAKYSTAADVQVSTLQAAVENNQIAASVQNNLINAEAYVTIASLPYTSVTQDLINKVNSTSTAVSSLTGTVNTLSGTVTQTNSDLTALRNATGSAIADIDQWSTTFQGGKIVNNIPLFNGAASTNQAIAPRYGGATYTYQA